MLRVERIECLRNEQQLFSHLSFSVQAGQVLFVEGANGSGKTTLLRMLCGLRQPDEGAIYWHDQPILESASQYAGNVIYIGHHAGVKRDLTVEENLKMVSGLIATKSDLNLESILDSIRLFEYADQLAGHLSAGQQRRVALARLLMSAAKIWILDEPFTSLDVNVIAWLESLFVEHVAQGGMIVLTSHQAVNLSGCEVVSLRLGR